jgi:prophage regulatory protein
MSAKTLLSYRLLRLPQVRDLTGLGTTKIYALEKEDKFPHRVKLSRSSAWVEEEVFAFIAARIADRDARTPTKRSPTTLPDGGPEIRAKYQGIKPLSQTKATVTP